jgi:sugar lactone lactonase YvrE
MRIFRVGDHALLFLLLFVFIAWGGPGCRRIRPLTTTPPPLARPAPTVVTHADLVEVATSDRMWTGVAVSKQGRIFVCYPRWSEDVPFSVGEIAESGEVIPFPDEEWNRWDASMPPGEHLVCVQSLYIDRQDNLWILDPGNAYMKGVVPGGAKLLKVDLAKDKVTGKILFDTTIAPPASYLNDVRVDIAKKVAYITDSGLGALIVVDLATGESRRLLAGHHSTKSEDIVLTVGGKAWRVNGQAPKIHADGLALDPDGKLLYYQALTGRTLYRIETRWLLDAAISERQLETKVESMYQTGAADGMAFGPDGYLYLAAIEDSAIKVFVSLGRLQTVIKDPRLKWPDSLAWGPDGYLYVTTSRIHLGNDRTDPYRIFRLKPRR